jgi:hypothetical protein
MPILVLIKAVATSIGISLCRNYLTLKMGLKGLLQCSKKAQREITFGGRASEARRREE